MILLYACVRLFVCMSLCLYDETFVRIYIKIKSEFSVSTTSYIKAQTVTQIQRQTQTDRHRHTHWKYNLSTYADKMGIIDWLLILIFGIVTVFQIAYLHFGWLIGSVLLLHWSSMPQTLSFWKTLQGQNGMNLHSILSLQGKMEWVGHSTWPFPLQNYHQCYFPAIFAYMF